MRTAFATGLREARRQPRLALALWLINVALAAVVAGPTFVMLRRSLAYAPVGDRLLHGFSFAVLAELAQAEAGAFPLLVSFLAAATVLSLLANALTSGGVLEVLTTEDRRGFLARFGGGAGRFFGRFLRAGLVAGVVMLVAAGTVFAAAGALLRRFQDSAWEPMAFTGGLVTLTLVGGIAVVALLALDFARIGIVRRDSRGVLRAYAAGLRLVLGRPVAALGIWAGYAVLFGATLAAYAGLRHLWSSTLLMVAAQQAVMLARAGLRVALFAGEIALDPLDRQGDPVAAAEAEGGNAS